MTDRTFYAFCGAFAGCLLACIAFTPMNVDPVVALALGAIAFVVAAAFALWVDGLERRRRHRRRTERRVILGPSLRSRRRWN